MESYIDPKLKDNIVDALTPAIAEAKYSDGMANYSVLYGTSEVGLTYMTDHQLFDAIDTYLEDSDLLARARMSYTLNKSLEKPQSTYEADKGQIHTGIAALIYTIRDVKLDKEHDELIQFLLNYKKKL